MKYILMIVMSLSSAAALAANDNSNAVPVMTPNQLKYFPFNEQNNEKSTPAKVTPLSMGQEYVLKEDRKNIKAFIALNLGILDLHGDKRDLGTIQQLIQRDVLKRNQVKKWQEVGVIFGDILAHEFNLHWVSYEDNRGVSTALQWRKTQNFVFPVTMFSKRVQNGIPVDAYKLYNEIARDVKQFIAYENAHPKMPTK